MRTSGFGWPPIGELVLFSFHPGILNIEFIKDAIDLLWLDLVWVEVLVPDDHIPEEITHALLWMFLKNDIQIPERAIPVPHGGIAISQVQRPAEQVVVNEHDLLMVPLEELVRLLARPMFLQMPAWIVPNYHPPSVFDPFNMLFICVEAQIINDQEYFDTSLDCISQLLKGDSRDVFVIHGIGVDQDEIFGVVDLLPEDVEKAIIIFVDLHGLLSTGPF